MSIYKPTGHYYLNTNSPQFVGLVGWWPGFAGGGGSKLFDKSGNGNNGTLTNFASPFTATSGWTYGKDGGKGALAFDGTDDYVNCGSGVIAALSNTKVTAMCWIFPTGDLTAYLSVFDNSTDGSKTGRQVCVFLGGAANHIYVNISGSPGNEIVMSDSWVNNVWQHLAMTCDGSIIRVFRNGISVGSGSDIGPGFTATPFLIGGNTSSGGGYYAGNQEDVRVYKRALSPSEIWKIYDPVTRWQLRYVPGRVNYSFGVSSSTPSGLLLARRRRMALCS